MIGISEIRALRCVNCGAPLPPPKGELVTCKYCGYTQRIVDAQEYLNQLRAEIYKWLRSIIPQPLSVIETVDPVARFQIFENLIKPKLSYEVLDQKSKYSAILSKPLVPALFTSPWWFAGVLPEPKQLFAKSAMIEGIEKLAIDQAHKDFIVKSKHYFTVLAYISNAINLISSIPRKYDLAAENLASAAESCRESKLDVGFKRMQGLSHLYTGINYLLGDKVGEAREEFSKAVKLLGEAMTMAMSSPETVTWYQAIVAEHNIAKDLLQLAELLQMISIPPVKVLEKIERVVQTRTDLLAVIPYLRSAGLTSASHSAEYLREIDRYREVVAQAIKAIRALHGFELVDILEGEGEILLPFHLFEINYTFVTGKLFWKKGKIGVDYLLVPAVLGVNTLKNYLEAGGVDVTRLVTNIFGLKPKTGITDRFLGKEEKLTLEVIKRMLSKCQKRTASGNMVLPALSKEDAQKIVDAYLDEVRVSLARNLRIGVANYKGLVYISGYLRERHFTREDLPPEISPLVGEYGELKPLILEFY